MADRGEAPRTRLIVLACVLGGWSSSAAAACENVGGAELVLGRADARYVIVGERHGTTQIPAFFGDLVCLASTRGPVIVGLEMETHQQESLNRYLRSDGGGAARATLLAEEHWRNDDGRASVAMFALIDRLRAYRAAGRHVTILAFMRPGHTPEARERGMAEAWVAAVQARPGARLIALVGRVHAETEAIGFGPAAASYLPAKQRVTLSYVPSRLPAPRVLPQAPPEHAWPRYDLYYTVGASFTPSPLAREQAATIVRAR